ncbi:hypothetical protein ACSBR1_011873 [Camellia fascicularis]
MGANLRPQIHIGVNPFAGNWVPPSSGNYKINYDVAVKKGYNQAEVVTILRDCKGELIDGLTKQSCISSSLQGEALACCLACQLAQDYNLSMVEVEGGNKLAIHLCVSDDIPPWECGAIVNDIKMLATRGNLSFHWCPRAANGAAH